MPPKLLDDIIRQMPRLLPLPRVIDRALSLIQDQRSSMAHVAQVIDNDPALAAKLLHLANSAFYFSHRRVGTVEQAMVRVGFTAAREMLLSTAVWQMMEGKDDLGVLRRADLWRHSVGTALCARALVGLIGGCRADEAYTAGLLHDVGKMPLALFSQTSVVKALALAGSKCSLAQAEVQVLGFHHGDVGGRLLESWNISSSLVEAVRHHHTPPNDPDEQLPAIVHVANSVSDMMGLSVWPSLVRPPVSAAAFASLGLCADDLEKVMTEARRALQEVEQSLGIAA
jgi:putative nucleotidyltransferase with HDIG domain